MKNNRIKGTMLSVLLAVAAVPGTNVYAGSINGNEKQLLSYASGTFEHQGHTYKATDEALSILRSKLVEDGVDLTDDQLAKAYAMAPSYVESAIYNGYLVQTDNEKDNENAKQEKAKTPSAVSSAEPSIEQSIESVIEPSKENAPAEQDVESETKGYDKYYTNKEEEQTVTRESYLEGNVSVKKGDDVIYTGTLPVKNTGYTTKKGQIIVGMLSGMLVLTIAETVRLIYRVRGKHE